MSRRSGPAPGLSAAVALLFVQWVAAQNTNTNTNTNQQTNQPATTATPTQQTTTQNTQTTQNAQTTQRTTQQTTQQTTAAQVTSNLPNINDSTSSTTSRPSGTLLGPSGMPTLAGAGIPDQVVPWTAGAPFMEKSNLPEGTVFIAVGAILGFMGMAVLAWRGVVAWSLHRSVKKANNKIMLAEKTRLTKTNYSAGQKTMAANSVSLDQITSNQRKSNIRSSSVVASNQARPSSLFFSPTAGAGQHSAAVGGYSAVNRSSSYLPAGYYGAPGTAAPHNAHIGSGAGRGPYGRNSQYQPSPPSSPGLPPSRGNQSNVYSQPSVSSLSLHVPGNAHPGGRVPSANMDDMFGNDPASHRR